MKALCVHAHFDDFEFTAAGTFELWRRRLGADFTGRVLVCTDGQAGHHFRPRAETARLRLEEQAASARLGGYEFELLRLPDGRPPREACLQVSPELLAALWKAIRDFEPDYLFCPPMPSDPLIGLHNDHATIADAVRRVAYMINVPHAFIQEYPADETVSRPCRVPVILNVHDGYMHGANACDLVIDVEAAFDKICEMSWCHHSQIVEWIPWVGRHQMTAPRSFAEWSATLRRRFERRSRELGLTGARAVETFQVTAWGEVPEYDRLRADLPGVVTDGPDLRPLEARLARWRQG